MRLPKRLEENPLLDVIAEVRFTSQLPQDTIVGLVYSEIKDSFGAPQSLPILQVPAPIRDKDPNLRYAACYRFDGKGAYVLLSPRSIALGNPRPYKDWDSVTPTLKHLLAIAERIELIDKVERTGLRYINFFEDLNVLLHSTLTLQVAGQSIADQNITVRAEHKEGNFIKVFQAINTALTEVEGQMKPGSVVDIDVICDPVGDAAGSKLSDHLYNVFTESNAIADRLFFGLLKSDFISKYKPTY